MLCLQSFNVLLFLLQRGSTQASAKDMKSSLESPKFDLEATSFPPLPGSTVSKVTFVPRIDVQNMLTTSAIHDITTEADSNSLMKGK